MTPTVLELYIAPRMHQPMVRVERVSAIADRGLDGDHRCSATLALSRHAKALALRAQRGLGVPTRPYDPRTEPYQRQVSLLDLDALDAGNAAFLASGVPDVRPLTACEMRRNIVTRGIDLNALVGTEFTIGGVRCRGTVMAYPCSIPLDRRKTEAHPYREDHYEAFMAAFWPGWTTSTRIGHRLTHAGLNAEILSSGVIEIGAEISGDQPANGQT